MMRSTRTVHDHPFRSIDQGGTTLIELIVAITMSAIVVGTIFFAWNTISRHISVQSRKSIFEVEARRIIAEIGSDLRRTPRLLAWHTTGLTLIDPTTNDTVSYTFTSEELNRNDSPLVTIAPTAVVTDFEVEAEEASEPAPYFNTLLHVHLRMEDRFGNVADHAVDIAVHAPHQEDEKKRWNY
jgi:type II secretory pathway pseudopilin PulG